MPVDDATLYARAMAVKYKGMECCRDLPIVQPREPIPATVLDPFMGSGTVAQVAQALRRAWVGIDIDPENERLLKARLANPYERGPAPKAPEAQRALALD